MVPNDMFMSTHEMTGVPEIFCDCVLEVPSLNLNRSAGYLTFRNRASYIYRTGTPGPSKNPILGIFSTNIRTEFFKHAAHTTFFLFKIPFIS
jgi:hypothetical protein